VIFANASEGCLHALHTDGTRLRSPPKSRPALGLGESFDGIASVKSWICAADGGNIRVDSAGQTGGARTFFPSSPSGWIALGGRDCAAMCLYVGGRRSLFLHGRRFRRGGRGRYSLGMLRDNVGWDGLESNAGGD